MSSNVQLSVDRAFLMQSDTRRLFLCLSSKSFAAGDTCGNIKAVFRKGPSGNRSGQRRPRRCASVTPPRPRQHKPLGISSRPQVTSPPWNHFPLAGHGLCVWSSSLLTAPRRVSVYYIMLL